MLWILSRLVAEVVSPPPALLLSVVTLSLSFVLWCTDSLYTRRFRSFISFNDSLPSSYSYSGPGTCYTSNAYVYSSGVTTLNCNRSGGYLLIVGRYVTIWPYTSLSLSSSDSTWASVLTVCEVTVVGVRQNISVDGNYSHFTVQLVYSSCLKRPN